MPDGKIPLREVQVRLVRPDEVPRWNALMRAHHYLGFRKMCGRRLRHVAVWRGRWLALLGWHAAALHCAARDRWIGWTSLQRRTRLFLIANNTRYLLLPGAAGTPRLASRVLGRSLARLRRDWQAVHGHGLLLAESFVDPARFAGTCYRAANWLEVGRTRGFGRMRGAAVGYVAHGAPKTVFVYPLRRDARRQLAAAAPRAEWKPWRPRIMLSDSQLQSLREFLEKVSDTRGQRGLRYPTATLLTIVLAARMAGRQTLTRISDFGRPMSQRTLRRIGARLRPQTGRYHAPGISTLHYALGKIDAPDLERLTAEWMQAQVPEEQAVAIDGKTMRGSYCDDLDADGQPQDEPARQQLTAVGIDSGVVLGHVGFSGKKDEAEGQALRDLLPSLPAGITITADALHTVRATAQRMCDGGYFYVFEAKGNQPKIELQLRTEYQWSGRCHRTADCHHGRIETREIRVSSEIDRDVPEPWLDFPGARFAAELIRQVEIKKTGEVRDPVTVHLVTNLPPEQATPERLLALNRGHWTVENRIHWIRDKVFQEDKCRVRKGVLPRVLAALTNLAISLFRLLRVRNVSRFTDQNHCRPGATAALVAA